MFKGGEGVLLLRDFSSNVDKTKVMRFSMDNDLLLRKCLAMCCMHMKDY